MIDVSKRRATTAAKRILANFPLDWKLPAGNWIEKDAFVLASYFLAQRKKQLTPSQPRQPDTTERGTP